MRSIWITAIIILLLFITVGRSDATLKNQTGEGRRYYWNQLYEMPQWQTQQGWVPQQNLMQPQSVGWAPQQGGGWALPPGGMPIPGWVPSSMQPTRPPFLWTLFDDIATKNLGNVCTLDASILVVLENDESTASAGLNVNAQPPPSYYGGDLSSNAGDVHGFLINSTRLIAGQFPDITLPQFQQMKRGGSIPPLTLSPLPPISCVCCGPRRFFTSWSPSVPNPPSQSI